MKQTKFKVGDKVKVVDEGYSRLQKYAVFTVLWSGFDAGKDCIGVENNCAEWFSSRFELVVDEPKAIPEGIRTIEQVKADRRKEILDGVVRYHTSGLEIPQEWINELAYMR